MFVNLSLVITHIMASLEAHRRTFVFAEEHKLFAFNRLSSFILYAAPLCSKVMWSRMMEPLIVQWLFS